ncbi:MAG: DUF123 domain-containing protein [Chloroflexi bacterium]|nr:DUF123 domain-containing protein [Chloroflexota bacterium]
MKTICLLSQPTDDTAPDVTKLSRRGSYILTIQVSEPLAVRFGGFNGGAAIPIEPGSLIYIGSALAKSGGGSLPWRLLRHASRTDLDNPHLIRMELLRCFATIGWGSSFGPPRPKTLHWHVDYLLDHPQAQLSHLLIIADPRRLEDALVTHLAAQDGVKPLAPGLGASDSNQTAHLLRSPASVDWWSVICQQIAAEFSLAFQ